MTPEKKGEARWRCRVRKGSVRPKLNVVPLPTERDAFHEKARTTLLNFAHGITSEETVTGYAIVIATKESGALAAVSQMWVGNHCAIPEKLWPAFVADRLHGQLLIDQEA